MRAKGRDKPGCWQEVLNFAWKYQEDFLSKEDNWECLI